MPPGPQYAVVAALGGPLRQDQAQTVEKYCGLAQEEIRRINAEYQTEYPHNQAVLCRGRDARAVRWIAAHLSRVFLTRIVEDQGEEEDLLRGRPEALDVPPLEEVRPGGPDLMGFLCMVGAVVAGVILERFLHFLVTVLLSLG